MTFSTEICWNGSVLASRSGMMKQTLDEGLPIAASSPAKGCLSWMTSVLSSRAVIESIMVAANCPKLSRFDQRVIEATTSLARTGSPSWNLSPSRSAIV
jgi:hypothetical protein